MLNRSLTYHLSCIAEEGIGNATRIFEQRFGWNVYEIRVLRLVRDEPGVTFTRLAKLTKFERSATSRTLSRLIRAGLVERTNLEHDARQFSLAVTRKGKALCAKADPLSLELEALMLAPLGEVQRRAFRKSLSEILAWVRGGYAEKVVQRFPEARGEPVRKVRPARQTTT